MNRFLVLALLIMPPALAQTATETPFGLRAGMTLEELEKIGKVTPLDTPGFYTMTVVPAPDRRFEMYTLRVAPKAGLCSVTGIGSDMTTNGSGDRVRTEFNDLETWLSKSYGRSERYDFLREGSSLQERRELFMLGLSTGDWFLFSSWSRDEGSALPPSLSSIVLEAKATSTTVGYVNALFEFANIEACDRE